MPWPACWWLVNPGLAVGRASNAKQRVTHKTRRRGGTAWRKSMRRMSPLEVADGQNGYNLSSFWINTFPHSRRSRAVIAVWPATLAFPYTVNPINRRHWTGFNDLNQGIALRMMNFLKRSIWIDMPKMTFCIWALVQIRYFSYGSLRIYRLGNIG